MTQLKVEIASENKLYPLMLQDSSDSEEDLLQATLLDKNPEGNREDKLIVLVKNLDMVDFYIDVAENDSIRVVKAKIQDKEGFPMHVQRLIYRGTTPNDDTTLSSLNVKQGNKLHFSLQLDGGGIYQYLTEVFIEF
jgi:hypothetical protein